MNNSRHFMITASSFFEGYSIKEYYGPVFGETVFKTSIFKSLGSGLQDLGNSFHLFSEREMTGVTGLIENAQNYALKKIEQEARRKGANAIIGFDAETTFGGDAMLMHVSMYGTAVRIEKNKTEPAVMRSDDGGSRSELSDDHALICSKTNYDERFIVYQLSLFNDHRAAISIVSEEEIKGIKLHFEMLSLFDEIKKMPSVEVIGFTHVNKITWNSNVFQIPDAYYDLGLAKEIYPVIEKYVTDDMKTVTVADTELKDIDKQGYVEERSDVMVVPDSSVINADFFIDPDSGNSAGEIFEVIKGTLKEKEDPACNYILDQLQRIVNLEKWKEINQKKKLLDEAQKWGEKYCQYLVDKYAKPVNENTIECPLCGTQQQARRNVCLNCGIKLEKNY